jgi:transposase
MSFGTQHKETAVITASNRIIGVRHRVKKTAAGEARPTQIVIREQASGKTVVYELEDDQAELDFVIGRFPTVWRDTTSDDQIENLPDHHIKWKKVGPDADVSALPERQIKKVGKTTWFAHKVPSAYDGLQPGDVVCMILGGSGDRFAFALANKGASIGSTVHRIPAFVLKNRREDGDKDADAHLVIELFEDSPELFYAVRQRDTRLIALREALRRRMDVMRDRIACEQRLRQRFIGKVFLSVDGHFPEGGIEDEFDALKASDPILSSMLNEEEEANKALASACGALDVYVNLFDPIEGCGPAIASRIIASVCDVRMFATAPKLKAYVGVHVLRDGRFPRQRGGEMANWSPAARQALFLFMDQCNKRPGSVWGIKLREYKAKLRVAHPEPVIGQNGKKKYTDGHIHKMACWRTATKFVEWLWKEWWKMEGGPPAKPRKDGSSNGSEPGLAGMMMDCAR